MAVIYKYEISSLCSHDIPYDSEILYVHEQDDCIFIWVQVPDPNAPTEKRYFEYMATGESFNANLTDYLGSAHLHEGRLVYHVYEVFDNRVVEKLAAIERRRDDLDIKQGLLFQHTLDPAGYEI